MSDSRWGCDELCLGDKQVLTLQRAMLAKETRRARQDPAVSARALKSDGRGALHLIYDA